MALGEVPGRSRAANLNVELACSTFGGVKIVIAIDDLESARAALQCRQAHAEGPTRCRLARCRTLAQRSPGAPGIGRYRK